ncbi:uncharacterized protein BX664DRAFT_338990 [Halteromyces radiatus]|uniref:uncharacterized protein n=1 Tax=Halteromyces radiatus TaxID=101107 RepID=UPI0022206691|nr:uncharacterized protein BX664DRAFT_338990 [Halteromyces radiatus]KAI8082757.1 hypothetical protein BX664DRAFT_338990 [Halteromyces radiatus]
MIATYSYPSNTSETKRLQRFWRTISTRFKSKEQTKEDDDITLATITNHTIKQSTLYCQRRKSSKPPTFYCQENIPLVPPFSPTYCQRDVFPYSNFYVKLPDGRWMIRFRDGNRGILRTDIINGYYI